MGPYVAQRLLQLVFVFFGVTAVLYAAVWVLPGDPIQTLAGGQPLSDSTIQALRDQFHLDDPLYVQYANYIGNILTGNFGTDFFGRSIADQMAQRWPVTIQLALTAWAIEIVVGLSLGVYAAIRHKRLPDYLILAMSMVLISIPVFVLAYVGQLVIGVRLGWLPAVGISEGWPVGYILPAVLLAAFGAASVIRIVRASVLENLNADYTRTAFAKGLSKRRVLTRHVLRNSLIPAVTLLGIDLGYLLAGTVIIEGIFNIPGIGNLLFQAIIRQEGLVVVTVSTILVLVFLVANLIVDLLYGLLDPRVTHD